MKDFRALVYQSEPEWAVWAVEAPLEKVATTLASLSKGKIWSRDILAKPRPVGGADIAKMTPLFEINDSAWTVGFRTVGFFMVPEAHLAREHAMKLSGKLKTRSVATFREAVSGETSWEGFKNGKRQAEDDDQPIDEKSLDMIFRTMGIYIPAALLFEEKGKVHLQVEPTSKPHVKNAWIVLSS